MMPIPKPKKNEEKDDFLSRCMSDDIMVEEYPDKDQRYAICLTQWKDKDKNDMELEIERRNIDLLEFRVVEDENKQVKINGYAALFNKLSESIFGFREKIAPGAFANSIRNDDIRALFNHDANYVLGRNKAKTLNLEEDEKGLAIKIYPPDTQWARDLQESIKRGDISQMSFSFIKIKDSWFQKKDKEAIRTLEEVKLFDVSPVTYPAYPQTSVAVRDFINALRAEQEKLDEQGDMENPEASLKDLRLKYIDF